MKISEGMTELLEKHYMHNDILTLIKSMYGLVQSAYCWFKECINNIALMAVFGKCKTGTCLLLNQRELFREVDRCCLSIWFA